MLTVFSRNRERICWYVVNGLRALESLPFTAGIFICAEGISQAEMLAFQFGAAREREKLAKRVSHRFKEEER